jgi:hypothetical protein
MRESNWAAEAVLYRAESILLPISLGEGFDIGMNVGSQRAGHCTHRGNGTMTIDKTGPRKTSTFDRFYRRIYVYSRKIWAVVAASAAIVALITAAPSGGIGKITLCFFCLAS